LRTVQSILDEGLAFPIVIGRNEIICKRIKHLGLRMRPEKDIEIIDPEEDKQAIEVLAEAAGKNKSVTINTLIAARMINNGKADGLICGTVGQYHDHLKHVINELGVRNDVGQPAAMNIVLLKKGVYFICDTAVTSDPSTEQIAEITLLAAEGVRRFGITPKAALLSYCNNGTANSPSASKMYDALENIKKRDPDLDIDGQMRADAALIESIREVVLPGSQLNGKANLLIMPNLDAAKIAYDLIKVLGEATTIGPILLGLKQPVHIMTSSSTVRRILNASALVAVDAQMSQSSSNEEVNTAVPVRRAG